MLWYMLFICVILEYPKKLDRWQKKHISAFVDDQKNVNELTEHYFGNRVGNTQGNHIAVLKIKNIIDLQHLEERGRVTLNQYYIN